MVLNKLKECLSPVFERLSVYLEPVNIWCKNHTRGIRRVKWWSAVVMWLGFLFYWYQTLVVGVIGRSLADAQISPYYFVQVIYLLIACVFFSAIFTPPKPIPEAYKILNRNKINAQIKALGLTRFTVCNHCDLIKPPRAHHCKICERCVMKMDHHCPILQTCVHHHNQKFYLLYLILPFLFATFVVFWIYSTAWTILLKMAYNEELTLWEHALFGAYSNALVIMLGVGYLLKSQLPQLALNRTSIEQSTIEDFREEEPKTTVEIYDKGLPIDNVRAVFGESLWQWFLPIYTTEGDGTAYKARMVRVGSLGD